MSHDVLLLLGGEGNPWTEAETILALDLLVRAKGFPHQADIDVLASLLGRSPGSVGRKVWNLVSAQSGGTRGLPHRSHVDDDIVAKFSGDKSALRRTAGRFRRALTTEGGSSKADEPSPIDLRPVQPTGPTSLRADAFGRESDPEIRRVLVEKAITGHRALVRRLSDALVLAGATCSESPRSVDLLARWDDATLLLEAKTVTTSPLSQVRHGVAQLHEYEYRLRNRSLPDLRLALAFDRRIETPKWAMSYLVFGRGITVIWPRTDERFHASGPAASFLAKRSKRFVAPAASGGA